MERQYSRLLFWLALALPSASLLAQTSSAPAPKPLVVHEWGTFTSLQDEAGRAIGGINTDDEPVPQFVHHISEMLLLTRSEVPPKYFQGTPACHPDVTMRLETPVLYFHPAPAQATLRGVSVSARFRGGWLTEFYPKAEAVAPGVMSDAADFGPLPASTVSRLTWNNLAVGRDADASRSWPVTTEHVWTAPRGVEAASVRTSDGESEKFLFYRGVAHIDAPLGVSQGRAGTLALRGQLPRAMAGQAPLTLKFLWLVDIAANGRLAFRTLPALRVDDTARTLSTVPGTFEPGDYDETNLEKLKSRMHAALVAEGLFADEAQALLDTWELSYFKSTGLRLFFMVPQAWTDHYLPLNISTPAAVTRVMVGRVELVTPLQRGYLRQLAQMSSQQINADAAALYERYFHQLKTNHPSAAVARGDESLAAFGVEVPHSYQLYLALGRFRNALLLQEARAHPSPTLQKFINVYHLEGFKPVSLSAANSH